MLRDVPPRKKASRNRALRHRPQRRASSFGAMCHRFDVNPGAERILEALDGLESERARARGSLTMLTPPGAHRITSSEQPTLWSPWSKYGDLRVPALRARLISSFKIYSSDYPIICIRIQTDFPLSQAHPHALSTAEASEARSTGRALLADARRPLPRTRRAHSRRLVAYASDLDLDVDRFAHELAGGVYRPKFAATFARAAQRRQRHPDLSSMGALRRQLGRWDPALILANMMSAKSRAATSAPSTSR